VPPLGASAEQPRGCAQPTGDGEPRPPQHADPETFWNDTRFALGALPVLTTRPDQIRQLRQTILNLPSSPAAPACRERRSHSRAGDAGKRVETADTVGREQAVRDRSGMGRGLLCPNWAGQSRKRADYRFLAIREPLRQLALGDEEKLPFPTQAKDSPRFDNLYVDNRAAAAAATRFLLDRGHIRIAMIAGPGGPQAERAAGSLMGLTERGLKPDIVDGAEFNEVAGRDAALKLLARAVRPTALFAANDLMAIGAMCASRASPSRAKWQSSASTTFSSRGWCRPGLPPFRSFDTRSSSPWAKRCFADCAAQRRRKEPVERCRMN
jgi:hypothetical protein